METTFNIGDRILYRRLEATIIGFCDKNDYDFIQIEFDKNDTGHTGDSQLYDSYGNIINCGRSSNRNRWNVKTNGSNIKLLEPTVINDFTKIIDKDSSELEKQGIIRI